LDQCAAKLAPPSRERFLANAAFSQRCYAAHWLTDDEYRAQLRAAVDELRLQQPEGRM
jgi:hypothetical protein